MNVLQITPDGVVERVDLDREAFHNVVAKGLFPASRLTDRFGEDPALMLVAQITLADEDSGDIPRNELASRLFFPEVDRERAYFVGDAYVVAYADNDLTDLPETVTVARLEDTISFFADH